MNKNFLNQIKSEAINLTYKTNEELNLKILEIKKRSEKENLESLIIPWFAITQEVAFREIGLKHFDTQLYAGLLLHKGKIVEMKTGEGKTLASTLPVALNALTKKGVHVVTVNDYLAERDQKWMGKVYKGLGLNVGLVKNTSSFLEKKDSYSCDITYVTNSELVFDYLRDSSAFNVNEIVQRAFNFCIIDEIDSILIDEARTPLILSTFKGEINLNKLSIAKVIANLLQKDLHFQLDEKRKDINLTEKGYQETQERLGKKSLYEVNDPWILEILNALKAKYIFKLNKDYIVLNNKIVIVDEFTGRIMEDRRWSMGIHEAIEIKENVSLGGETKTKSSITYQNFFTLYPKLAGMTGTAKTAEKEFQDIYNLDVIVLPTFKPMIRKDYSDFVYQTELSKWKAVLKISKDCFEKGQPILIGTASVEKSEFLSDLFKASKIPHQVLNAKPENIFRESEIVAQAGKRAAITIATNMAGRGTDIILGGNPIFSIKQLLLNLFFQNEECESIYKLDVLEIFTDYEEKKSIEVLKFDIENLPYSLDLCLDSLKEFYLKLFQTISKEWEIENLLVKNLGGLYVLGTERHETRRIDNQLRGRAGRQGDPGSSQFFVSLEDDLIKIFGGDSLSRWVDYLIQDKDIPLESSLLTKSLENAQKKIELYNYDIRKNVFQYDDILNNQRKQLFKARNEILLENKYNLLFLRYSEFSLDEELEKLQNKDKNDNLFLEKLEKIFDPYLTYFNSKQKNKKIKNNQLYKELWVSYDLRLSHSNFYELGFLKSTQATILLEIIDFYWTEHIDRMSCIRETINWRSYGQQNPLVEYNMEALKSFKVMFEQIRSSMVYYFLDNSLI
jgi:preprotein translocase subunit SecA